MTVPAGPLVLIDGMSLAFRAYFALPTDLSTSHGVVTNAVHGFCSMLQTLVKDHQPGRLAVAFDLSGGTFRDSMVDDYKGGRAETPADLPPQFDMIRSVLDALNIPVVGVSQMEADDVLATLATEAAVRGEQVIVVTGDRDSYQLVQDPFIKVLYNRRGVSDYALYDEAGILERTGVVPAKYPMLAALRGDPSDNLPGVPGVGEKTAAKLLNTYGDFDGIFSHLDELTPKLRENLAAHEQLARTNLEVMTLVRTVPMPVDVDALTIGGWKIDDLRQVLTTLEMQNQLRRWEAMLATGILGPAAEGNQVLTVEEPVVAPATVDQVLSNLTTSREVSEWLAAHLAHVLVAATWVGQPGRSAIRTLALSGADAEQVAIIGGVVLEDIWNLLAHHFETFGFSGHGVKELLRTAAASDLCLVGLDLDTSIAAYLIDASGDAYDLDRLEPLGNVAPKEQGLFATGTDAEQLARQLLQIARLKTRLEQSLLDLELRALYDDVERPLVMVLARMEAIGIAVDRQVLQDLEASLRVEVAALEAKVHELAGHSFNVNSTQQLRTVLYEELGLTPGKKTKSGSYSTDAQTLESLRQDHPIVETLLQYREVEKLRSTYGEALLNEVAADGRIHATFRQTVARTGRLSSEQPNLHNIPVRTEGGRRFRGAFIPRSGWKLLVADYDQIELRVIAHLSKDPGLMSAFMSGEDIHRTVAAGVYGVSPNEVTHAQRERAKMVSYGLAYGMEAFGLSRRLGSSVEEAKEIMDRYFAAFPSVQSYMDGAVKEARALGHTRTEMGRIRPLPELNDANFRIRQAAERQAMNAGIQGLAADLFKVALIRLDQELTQAHLAARLVLQVHDEVLVEAPPEEMAQVEAIVRRALGEIETLDVPLEISLAWGDSWATAKA
jgi:DNA polymerase-1